MNEPIYLKVDDIVKSNNYPFTLGQMNYLLLYRHKNGLEKAVRKIGKRIYIRKDMFDQWIESHQ